jgi:selenocysteine lyase/cysteine desulfurase
MQKREFLRTLGGSALGLFLSPDLLDRMAALPPAALAQDDPFWGAIRQLYRLPAEYLNLESGYFSMQAEPVLEAFVRHAREVNAEASHYMRTRAAADKLRVRTRLAGLAGCPAEELVITRNTTESMDTVISGYDWRAGDEAVMASHDYGAMLDHFRQMSRRHGMVNRVLDIPLHPRSDDEIVRLYADAITPRTRLLMICHVVNITGQVMPVAKVAAMARQRGVHVMVDGAHAFAQLDFRIPGLGVDYYGASLHKWLGCPLGAGILYVRKERIAGLWPLFGDAGFADDDIQKLNHTGTHPPHTDLAIEDAIAFHERIGVARKEARLRFLQQYWTSRARGIPKVRLLTPAEPSRTCAIATVAVEGVPQRELARRLMEEHKVWTVAITRPEAGVEGVRVTPHLFTSLPELDRLVGALRVIAA